MSNEQKNDFGQLLGGAVAQGVAQRMETLAVADANKVMMTELARCAMLAAKILPELDLQAGVGRLLELRDAAATSGPAVDDAQPVAPKFTGGRGFQVRKL